MITQNNLLDVIRDIGTDKIVDAIDNEDDYIHLSVDVFNAGFISTIETSNKMRMDIIEDGGLSLDTESFVRLLKNNNALPSVLNHIN